MNEARFEFVLIEGEAGTPNAGGSPAPGGLDETNRLLQRILEAQGFMRPGGDGASSTQQPARPISPDDLAVGESAIAVTPSARGGASSDAARPTAVPPSPRITTTEPLKPPSVSVPSIRQVDPPKPPESRSTEPAKPPVPERTTPEKITPPAPEGSSGQTDLGAEFSKQWKAEGEEISRRLRDELFGDRRRKRDAERGIIQAEPVEMPKPPIPTPATPVGPAEPPAMEITPTTAEPPEGENGLDRYRRTSEEIKQQFAREAEERRAQRAERRRRLDAGEPLDGPSVPPVPPAPAKPTALPPVPPMIVPQTIPAIGGAAVPVAAVAAGAGVAAGVAGVALVAKANYELFQAVDSLAKRLAPTLVDYSPAVAAAQAQADLREVMRTFATSDRLGVDVARMVEANSVIKDALTQIRDAVAGPLLADAASVKEAIAGLLSSVGGFFEANQGTIDALYNILTRYVPGPLRMLGDIDMAAEIIKRMTGYDPNKNAIDQIFMNDGMITPPGWSDSEVVDVSLSFSNPAVELP